MLPYVSCGALSILDAFCAKNGLPACVEELLGSCVVNAVNARGDMGNWVLIMAAFATQHPANGDRCDEGG